MTFNIYIHILQGRISAVLDWKRLDGKPGAALSLLKNMMEIMLDTVQGLKKCISLNHLVCFVVIKSLHEYLKIELQIVFMGSLCWIVS